jgi:hypothetical protein
MSKSLPPKPVPRTRVLVVLNSDGFVEVYGDDHINVHFTQRIHTDTRAGEILADQLVDVTLPRVYRDLFYPRNMRAAGQCRKVTAEQRLEIIADLDLLAILRGLRDFQEDQR